MKQFRFLPRTLSGRLLVLLVTGLLIIQTGTFFWLQRIRFEDSFRGVAGNRARLVVLVYTFLAQLTPQERASFIPKLHFYSHQFSLTEYPDFENGTDKYSAYFIHRLRALSLILIYGPDVPYKTPPPPDAWEPDIRARVDHFTLNWNLHFNEPIDNDLTENPFSAKAAIAFNDGTWLSVDYTTLPIFSGSVLGFIVAFATQFIVQVLLAFLAIRYLTKPLYQLTSAAEQLCPDDPECPPLPSKGTHEVLHAAQTFKSMHTRIRTFVDERITLLASLSHDLRSPVTRLRLQIEKEPHLEERRLMLDALDDLQQLMEDTIDLARCGQNNEPSVPLDIGSLVQSITYDYMDEGKTVSIKGESKSCCLVRVSSMRRSLKNLIDNALRYGKSACILLEEDKGYVHVSILDEGPGIPKEQFKSVFQPFYRLEGSRNKLTGGTGLGLTIAQGLIRLHGSEITMKNRPEGGLSISFSLPICPVSIKK